MNYKPFKSITMKSISQNAGSAIYFSCPCWSESTNNGRKPEQNSCTDGLRKKSFRYDEMFLLNLI